MRLAALLALFAAPRREKNRDIVLLHLRLASLPLSDFDREERRGRVVLAARQKERERKREREKKKREKRERGGPLAN